MSKPSSLHIIQPANKFPIVSFRDPSWTALWNIFLDMLCRQCQPHTEFYEAVAALYRDPVSKVMF